MRTTPQIRVGRLIVLSGPSGSGKSTVVKQTLAAGDLPIRKAISATTRGPRPGEIDGVHYHFWTAHQFDQGLLEGRFVEWAQVYGHRYGTLKTEVEPYLAEGLNVLLEIDVQGAMEVRRLYPECLLVFIRASTLEEYEKRLRARGTEAGPVLERRLQAARQELALAAQYDWEIINDDLDAAVRAFRTLLQRCGGDTRAG
jgi:guanylate kinase